MLNALPKTSEYIFPTTIRNLSAIYYKTRKRLAKRINYPRLLSISPVTFRHWGATMLYHQTQNVLLVQKMLGHKNINSTMKYIGRIDWKKNRDFDVVTATSDEEIKNLGALGYTKYDERPVGGTVISYYRRPKIFGSVKV